jgi:hydrogenase maturation protein HypF
MHRRLAVRGLVQGVGFRPWVWQQATSLGLIGWVRNTGSGVEIDLHGEAGLIDTFQAQLWQVPAPARVEQVDVVPIKGGDEPSVGVPPNNPFEIQPSVSGTFARATTIGTDLSTCPRCLGELFNASNRRWRHPFINCPQCGPRYTVTRSLPFDRGHTSMAKFLPCAACDAEYLDSTDRRFHHQTNACPDCGPRLWLRQADGSVDEQDPIAATVKLLLEGGIVAIKGLGGFHLCCDARQPTAVARLRQRKHRDSKPLAVMMANAASVEPWAKLHAHELRWLQSPERPIVLLEKTERAQLALPDLAPDLAWLGVMLPYTPMQYMLFHEACSRPTDAAWLTQAQPLMLVMTSGNAAGSPLVTDNETALLELAEMADAWLMHDREILARNDDSVLRVRPDGSACFLRRGRGYAPTPVALPTRDNQPDDDHSLPPAVLALGALLKSTLCITQGDRALVSPHVGDLDSVDTRVAFTRLADMWPGWLNTQPDALACDLHPDYFSTILAAHLTQTRASTASGVEPLPLIQVQHHHAHIAAVLAEHSDQKEALKPIVGLALDGHGLGSNGQAWGGELLRVHGDQAQRLGHLRPMPMPGGDQAAREPWRMAAAVLHDLGRADELPARFANQPQLAMLQNWLQQPAGHQAHTTSLGRLFDAAAGLLNLLAPLAASHYEAEAALRLESLAMSTWPAQPLVDGWVVHESMELDCRPLMHWIAEHTNPTSPSSLEPGHIAAVFHATLGAALADWAKRACDKHDMRTVVLAGGCMANHLLDNALYDHLQATGLQVWRPAQYPCGDGGLSLGQAWVARQRLIRRSDSCALPSLPA